MDDLVAQTWQKIQQEAQSMAAQEPMLASFFHSTILNHRDLRSALSFQLANKLDSTTMPAIALREVIELALRSEPELLAAVAAAWSLGVSADLIRAALLRFGEAHHNLAVH